jgi:putative ABC transport system ATP-binding protein
MIKLENAGKTYQATSIETLALRNISLQIERGEFVSIMGPSGCGKSTLLNLIGLLDRPTAGSVHIDGQKIESYRDKELARLRNHKIGFVFQEYHLIPDISVVDNVEIPLLYRSNCSSAERRKLALAALEKVGLSARVQHYPTQLSGGQQQRVAIARAIVGKPQIILADEPTGNLDSAMGNEIMSILENLNRDDDTTVVMVTHDEEKARRTQRILRIFDGQLIH